MYHSISPSREPDPHRVRVHPEQLDRQLTVLRRLGYRGCPLGDLLDGRRGGRRERFVALTFDDGYADFVHHAMPVLESHGMAATLFVVAGSLGGSNDWDDGPRLPLVTAADVSAVVSAGHEVGSHSLRHIRLSGLPPDVVRRELAESRRILTEITHTPVVGFCYPYGDFDGRIVAAVREAGYGYACVTDSYARPWDDLSVARFHVGYRDGPLRLGAKLVRHRLRGRFPGLL